MFNKSSISKAIQYSLLLGTVASGTAIAAEESDRVKEVEKIQVTGSRIVKPKLSQPAPIVTIGAKDIAQAGVPDLGSVLAELPAIGSTDTLIGNNDSNALAGVTSADLRRLGAARTLTLVNGKRHVAGAPGSAQVDLNTIPAALIERVEVITGGASAIYGSDAVSGVVNVILRDDFEGFEFNGSVGNSTEGVGTKNHSYSIVGGAEVFDGRGNVTFFAGKDRIREVMANDIRQVNHYGTIQNPENTGEEDGIPDQLTVPNVMSERISENGVINPFGAAGSIWTFDNNGVPELMPEREFTNSFAFGSFPDGCQYCFKTQDYENVYPDLDKTTVGSTFNFDLSDNHSFYSDFKFVRSDIKQQFQPSFRFGNVAINVQDNPYLDETLRQDLLSQGTEVATFSKFFGELGNRSAANKRELFRFVGGFEGYFTLSETDFTYDTYYVFGRTDNVRNTLNDLIPDNFVAALDAVIDPATGEVACRSQVPSAQGEGYTDPASVNGGDCAPYNPFGFNQASQAAKDWVSADVTRTDKITQEVVGGYVAFDSAELFELQGGPIGIATGFEYREETSETITDEFSKAGFLTTAATPDSYGEYDVSEGFIELSFPILAGMSFAEELTVDAAYRTADYSHTGSSSSWKVGLMYQPFDDLRIRGTIGEAERAPNIAEAFDPQSPGFGRVSDPCDADNIDDNPNRRANCAALGIPADFQANDNVSVDTLSGGNPDLKPEKSTSFTGGLVWTPSFAENFSMTLDYYDIEIEDAISFIATQSIADNCVDAAGGIDEAFCSQVDRDPETFDIELVRSGYLNAAAITTRGIDADFDYRTDLADFDIDGELTFNLFINHLIELEDFEFQNRPDKVNVENGEVGDPEWQGRFTVQYTWQDLNLTWTTRYTDRSARFDVSPEGDIEEDISPAYVGSIVTHDLSARYQLTDNMRVDLGLRNLTDKLPPAYIQASGGNEAIYDVVGRRFFANVNVTF
ncbi:MULTISPECIES: TonB-dependent receptor domain-containing protein [Pseudoalteromonas]|uniref:TonB-dependent receptor n=1 Tax=Pseudoalteromonas ruthenica TaxID=151081 RepID=A0A0F4PRG7_9GAMM|nr:MULTISPECIES: TonB-dependent receptor [Pseudoalteromonas]KJY98065.1 TonB-dependent receptor [Pseudoalteromonas ruthenica]KJZ02132.1 TonB-dependent receptor [Pseudoalteromonas ruthenica]MCF2860974.1 TonB-dependent receptor [Pseudoalteromonas sp. CNAT2-18]MCG7556843.1 TonB-dependent receptor [Pseudoalteromonas sp. CNAT2-18.1]MCG7569612.1 TonB-dependent receptor [Pseudoalteromonas sp. CNC9-20]|tara:strand:- start:86666 stop:89584 length:2919 start_codon:yes stop_codon:yes gene_type:complete